jgi:hypothetical protein
MSDIKKFNSFLNEETTDKKQKTVYKTVIEVVILSEEPFDEDNLSLSQIEYMITEDECFGKITTKSQDVLMGEEAVLAVKNQGSDPAFFQMDNKGFEIADETDDIDTQSI